MKMDTMIRVSLVAGTVFTAVAGFAAEPTYCTYSAFMKHEVPYDRSGIKNEHLFKFGDLHLAGLAVGKSKLASVVAMANDFSGATQNEKYCTWYFNDGDSDAEREFNWFNVDRPNLDIPGSVRQYHEMLSGIFADNATNMLDCATKHHYIALGCDGMKHRGPTVFGMLLAFSGCMPAHAALIVNSVWGLNTVPAQSRLAILTDAYKMGEANPKAREALQALLSN